MIAIFFSAGDGGGTPSEENESDGVWVGFYEGIVGQDKKAQEYSTKIH